MTELQGVEILEKLTNISTSINDYSQALTGGLYIIIGVVIACTISIILGEWMHK